MFSAFLLFCFSAFTLTGCEDESAATPPKAHTVRFSLASYNLYNFFDRFDNPYSRDETTRPQSDRTINSLKQTMLHLSPDFVGIQEVENAGSMIEFNRFHLTGNVPEKIAPGTRVNWLDGPTNTSAMFQQPLSWHDDQGYYPHVYVAHRVGGRGISNGFLSRIPIKSITTHRWDTLTLPGESEAWPFARPVVQATIQPAADVTVHVFIVHFKSKHSSPGDIKATRWRLAEALGVRKKIAALRAADPDAHVVMLGDFNDIRDSRTLQVLLAEGNDNAQLVDLFADYPKATRYTYIPKRFRSQIDHILATPELAAHMDPAGLIIHHPEIKGGSDHAPIVATFDVPTDDPDHFTPQTNE